MKKAGRLYRWILVSLILQVALLGYFELFYLNGSGRVRATAFEMDGDGVSERELLLPGDAASTKVSRDGERAAYTTGGKLELVSLSDPDSRKTLDKEGWELTCYEWLPDRPMIICGYVKNGKAATILVATYDLETGLERSFPELKDQGKDSRVEAIELSPLTNVVYVKVGSPQSKSRIYRFNINDNLKYVLSVDPDAVIGETLYSDYLLYEADKKVYYRDGKTGKARAIPVKGSLRLLGIDSEDRVYVGAADEEGNITSYYSGMIGENKWEQAALSRPSAPDRLIIGADGSVYELDESGGSLLNVVNGSSHSYQGDFIRLLENHIASRADGRLRLVNIK